MIRRAALTLALALAALPALAGDAARPIVRIATEGAFPPFNSLDAAGHPAGFEVDLGNAICARERLDCSWVLTGWAGIIPGLTGGAYDVIMAGMAITPDRAREIAFSRPYFRDEEAPAGIFVGTHSFQTPSAGRIAVQEGTIHETHLRAQGLSVLAFPTADAALQAVLDGRADTTFGSPDFLQQRVFHTSRMLVILGTEQSSGGGAAAGFRKAETALRENFNRALEALEKDGTIEKLRKKWFTPTRDI